MTKSFVALLALLVGATALSSPAAAADIAPVPKVAPPVVQAFSYRWYLEGRLGLPIRQEYDVNIGGGFGPATYEPDIGWHAAIAGGLQWSPNWRAELAFSYSTGRDGTVILGGAPLPHAGRVNVYTFLVNGYYIFNNFGPYVQPFIGAGIGLASFEVENLGAVGGGFVLDDSDIALALALHLGVDVPVARNVSLTGRYTLGYTGDVSFGSVPAGFTTTREAAVDHIFSIGARVYFD